MPTPVSAKVRETQPSLLGWHGFVRDHPPFVDVPSRVNLTTIGHSLDRIPEKIVEGFDELVRVSKNRRQIGGQISHAIDLVDLQFTFEKFDCLYQKRLKF